MRVTAHRASGIASNVVSPKTLSGDELDARRRARARRRALPRRRQQPRLPRVLRAPRGARDDRTASRRTRCSASRTCSSSCSPTTARRASPSRGTRGRCTARRSPRRRRRLQGGPQADAGPARASSSRTSARSSRRSATANLEFEGWEADDVIATLATRADEAGIKHLRRLDRPRRLPALLGERLPDDDAARASPTCRSTRPSASRRATACGPIRCPDFIGLKGDSSDNIPGVPGIGDKTAGQLIAQLRLARSGASSTRPSSPGAARRRSPSTPSRRGSRRSSRRCGATSRSPPRPAELVLAPPDRSQLKEIFRRFEFRGLLARLETLDEALPAAEAVRGEVIEVPWREGEPWSGVRGRRARCRRGADGDRRRRRGVVVAARALGSSPGRGDHLPRREGARRSSAAEDTLLGAYLIDPGRSSLRARRPRRRVRGRARPRARGRRGDRGARPAPPRCRAVSLGLLLERLAERGLVELYREVELPLTRVLLDMERAGVKIDTYRMGEITARLAERVGGARGARLRARRRGVHARLDAAGRAHPLRAARADGRAQGQDRLLDRRARCCAAIRYDHAIVAVIEEWRELSKLLNTYLGPLPELIDGATGRLHTTINQTVASTGRLSTTSPNLQSIPIRTELGREIRSAFIAEEGHSSSRPTTRRSSCASSRTSRASRSCARRSRAARTSTARRRPRCSASDPATLTTGERSIAKMINFGIVYGISAFGLSENLEIPREQAQSYIDSYLARFPLRAGLHRAHDRAGRRVTATSRACSAAAARCRRSAPRTARRARSASASRSTSSCRAPTPTSSRWR